MQAESMADLVVLTIKSALAPVLERLATAEARLEALGELRERVATVETKAAPVDGSAALDARLSAALERLAVAESHGAKALAIEQALTELRERVVAMETRAAMSQPAVDTDVRDRLTTLEAKSDSPSAADAALTHLTARLALLEQRSFDDSAQKECAAIRERVAVVESRAQVAGPAGPAGKDGVDGLGFDDIAAVQEDERTVVFKATRGDRVKEIGRMSVPVAVYRGVYQQGKSYTAGDVVTWGGSSWHCGQETTEKPGDGAPHWKLMVKRGSDGKDARDGKPAGLPVVTSTGARV